MKFQQFLENIFSLKYNKLVAVTIVSVVFICLTLLTPLLLDNSSERNNLHSFYTPTLTNQSNNNLIYYEIEETSFQPHFSLTSPPIPTLSISGTLGQNGWYTSDVKISLYTTENSSGLLQIEYTFYNQEWTTFTEPFTIFAEGQTAVYYRSRDVRGYIGVTEVQGIDIDKTPPNGSVLIDGGVKEAFSTLVTLNLSVIDEPSGPTTHPPSGYIWGVPSGPSDMRFSNNGAFWSTWESFASNKTWNLEAGAGTKTVYVQFRDNAGLVSETLTDTINLIANQDYLAPETKISLSGKKTSLGTYTSDVVIIFSTTDDLSGVNLTEYSFDENNWTEYTSPFYISAEGQTTIYYRTHDLAGNIESTNSQTIEIDRTQSSNSALSQPIIIVAVIMPIIILLGAIVILKRIHNKREIPRINFFQHVSFR
ncbi:hypothetical protein MUO71_01810 [Candidatus Bathyarchaeota archaeon]|nr:hypothetical protein [Candidatus Bathyarchaeota archaeon]